LTVSTLGYDHLVSWNIPVMVDCKAGGFGLHSL
jgi:hypothetical protein